MVDYETAGKTAAGAVVGGAFLGPVGAVAGGIIGYQSANNSSDSVSSYRNPDQTAAEPSMNDIKQYLSGDRQ